VNRKTTLALRVDALMLDATTLVALIEPALSGLDVASVGWPTSTPGADPKATVAPRFIQFDSDGNPIDDKSNATESAALNRDPAKADIVALEKAIKAAATQLRVAAIIAGKWGQATMDGKALQRRISAIDAGIWCDNCAKHGHKNPRRHDGRTCDYCASFQSDWKQPAPREVLDLRVTKGRVYDADVRRILGRLRDQRKESAEVAT
jgi:hypothetical protein